MKRILVVDDFRANVIMLQQALTGKYEIITATSGEEALRILRGTKPDLVVLDIQMPNMTGIDVLEKMKQEVKLKDIPVVFLTGQADKQNVTKGFQLGIQDVIAKPIVIKTIEERINRVLGNVGTYTTKERATKKIEATKKTETAQKTEALGLSEEFNSLFDDNFWKNEEWESFL